MNNWNWFHLKLARVKSFQHCYDQHFIDTRFQCTYTDDQNRYKTSEAVLFSGTGLQHTSMPKFRPPNQRWIFWEHEPPPKVRKQTDLTLFNGMFNITATYSLDSDIPRPLFLKHCTRNVPKWNKLRHVDFVKKKKKNVLVAWLVSTCKTQSQREKYVRKLQSYISVDIYGKCGPKKCGSRLTFSSDNCIKRLLHNSGSYKFYLAFENSLCEDYVTEKLWKIMSLDVVPVVMGGVDYAKMLPKDTYIDVADFESPGDLARYLQHLDQNDDLYNQYIRNKNSLQCTNPHLKMPWECLLCQRLHEFRNKRKVVHNLDEFWGSRRCKTQSYYFNHRRHGDISDKRSKV